MPKGEQIQVKGIENSEIIPENIPNLRKDVHSCSGGFKNLM
jgi:hypothetical protein